MRLQVERRTASACDESVVLHERYVDGCMFERNRYMVDHADMLYACLERPTGGTLYTVNYAKRKHKRIVVYGSEQLSMLQTLCPEGEQPPKMQNYGCFFGERCG